VRRTGERVKGGVFTSPPSSRSTGKVLSATDTVKREELVLIKQ
jgi:hypothetical protein